MSAMATYVIHAVKTIKILPTIGSAPVCPDTCHGPNSPPVGAGRARHFHLGLGGLGDRFYRSRRLENTAAANR